MSKTNEEDDKTCLQEFFGDQPMIRILDFLMGHFACDYTKTEIAKLSEVGWSTLYTYWDRLEKNKMVMKTRIVGNATLYKINIKNPLVKELFRLSMQISLQSIEPKSRAREEKRMLAARPELKL